MANFGIANSSNFAAQQNMSSVYQSLIVVAASSGSMVNPPTTTGLKRGKLYDILVGTNGIPADNFLEWVVQRATVGGSAAFVGSVSSVSSNFMLDQSDGGFNAFATVNTTLASSTLFSPTQQPWYVGINQRASYRWVANPGGEIVYPAVSSATGNNGLLLSARSGGYTGTDACSIMVQEQ